MECQVSSKTSESSEARVFGEVAPMDDDIE